MQSASDLGAFLTRDEKGRLLPEYLLSVSRQLAEEHATMLSELQSLTKSVDHIKAVVSSQPQPGGRLRIEVADNGVGIAPERLPRIFGQGFTTKKNGHGFGLHASALSAREMGGSLTCASPGRGQGTIFTIDLPLTPEQARA
jgi:sensor histidine kinase regulating citrate/malate metabolism